MQPLQPLTPSNFYHTYNRGINSCDLFREPENFEYFPGLYDKHISPIADTLAMGIDEESFSLCDLGEVKPDRFWKPVRFKTTLPTFFQFI